MAAPFRIPAPADTQTRRPLLFSGLRRFYNDHANGTCKMSKAPFSRPQSPSWSAGPGFLLPGQCPAQPEPWARSRGHSGSRRSRWGRKEADLNRCHGGAGGRNVLGRTVRPRLRGPRGRWEQGNEVQVRLERTPELEAGLQLHVGTGDTEAWRGV